MLRYGVAAALAVAFLAAAPAGAFVSVPGHPIEERGEIRRSAQYPAVGNGDNSFEGDPWSLSAGGFSIPEREPYLPERAGSVASVQSGPPPATVPEPATVMLLGLGLITVASIARYSAK